MISIRESLTESRPATPEAVGIIRRSVAEYASAVGIVGEKLDSVRLAVSEAVSNVVMHAYPGDPGQVHVTARAVDGELWVLISDDGAGHNIQSKRPGLGWGLALMTDACDEFTLAERSTGGTEARMCFRIQADPQSVSPGDQ